MTVDMARIVLRLPDGLLVKVQAAAQEEDKLPTEWVRDLLREAFEDEEEPDEEARDESDG